MTKIAVGDTVIIKVPGKMDKVAEVTEIARGADDTPRYHVFWGTGILSNGWYPETQVFRSRMCGVCWRQMTEDEFFDHSHGMDK